MAEALEPVRPLQAGGAVQPIAHSMSTLGGVRCQHAIADDESTTLSRMPDGLTGRQLHKQYECKDFNAAFWNMTRVALIAEAMNHHPRMSMCGINGF